MNELARRFDTWIEAYTGWVIRWRWLVLLGTALLAVAVAGGGRLLEFKNDYKVWFSDENPQLLAFETLQNTYTKNENVLFVIAPENGRVFAPEVLEAVERLTRDAWQLPYSIRVDSITNFQHTEARGDDLVVEDLVRDARSLSAERLAEKQSIALAEPLLIDRLINRDASLTAVNVTFQLPMEKLTEIPEAVAAARDMAARLEADYPALDVRLTGVLMLNNAFSESSIQDMSTLVPLMYLAILITMVLMLRSVSATLATTFIIIFSIITGMGAAGWLGMYLTPPLASAPTVIMTLAVADGIHVFVTMFAEMRNGLAKFDALKRSIRLNFQPIFLTSLTTAIGFLTMNASDAPPFRDFGNTVAIGVMAAWFFSMTFLPAAIAILPMRAPRAGRGYNLGMDALGDFVVRRSKPLLWIMALGSVALVAMIPRNELNDEFVEYFDTSVEFRRDTDFTTENLTGIYQVQYSLPAAESGGVSDPAYLAQVQRYVDWLQTQPEVLHVNTITDVFKRLNKNMRGDDPTWYRLPGDRELAAQYLLLYELSLPYGLDLNNQLNVDKSATQLIVTLKNISSVELREFAAHTEQWLAANAPEMFTHGVSPAIMFAHISERNINSMLRGTLIGLALISVLLMFAFRNIKIGTLSLIPNLLPAGLAFGVWALVVGQVNLAVSVVVGMTFGIVVDDTIHFLSKYLRAKREQGLSTADAIRYSFHHVGTALVITTIILAAGFMVLGMSSFMVNASMAKLTAMGIVLALAVDFLLLPPLLLLLDKQPVFISESKEKDDATVYATSD